VLEKAYREAMLTSELEHVTPFIWKNSTYKGGILFTSDCVVNEKDFSSIRLTVDTIDDFQVIEKLIQLLGTDKTWIEYVNRLEHSPEIMQINARYQRNEGYQKSINNEKE
jgi:spore coat polysaccharide biosynthesis protein SpsF (cytidylyltransferase family)